MVQKDHSLPFNVLKALFSDEHLIRVLSSWQGREALTGLKLGVLRL